MPRVDTNDLLRHARRPAGRTTDILKECQSWRPVQHLIVYNASGTSDARLAAIMAANGPRLASPAIAPNSFGLR